MIERCPANLRPWPGNTEPTFGPRLKMASTRASTRDSNDCECQSSDGESQLIVRASYRSGAEPRPPVVEGRNSNVFRHEDVDRKKGRPPKSTMPLLESVKENEAQISTRQRYRSYLLYDII